MATSAEKARTLDGYQKIQFDGKEREFCITDAGIREALEEDVDGLAAMNEIMPDSEGGAVRMNSSLVTSVTDLLYTGMLPFPKSKMPYEEVSAAMGLVKAMQLQQVIADIFPNVQAEDDDSGK